MSACLSRASDHKLNSTVCDHTGREMLREAQSHDFSEGLLSVFSVLIALCLSKKGTSVQEARDSFYYKVPLPQGSLRICTHRHCLFEEGVTWRHWCMVSACWADVGGMRAGLEAGLEVKGWITASTALVEEVRGFRLYQGDELGGSWSVCRSRSPARRKHL